MIGASVLLFLSSVKPGPRASGPISFLLGRYPVLGPWLPLRCVRTPPCPSCRSCRLLHSPRRSPLGLCRSSVYRIGLPLFLYRPFPSLLDPAPLRHRSNTGPALSVQYCFSSVLFRSKATASHRSHAGPRAAGPIPVRLGPNLFQRQSPNLLPIHTVLTFAVPFPAFLPVSASLSSVPCRLSDPWYRPPHFRSLIHPSSDLPAFSRR